MIAISEKAAAQVKRVQSEEGNEAKKFLRVQAVQGGCSGMSYKLDFETAIPEGAKTFEGHGVTVVVDTKSYLYLIGMTLDYEGGLNAVSYTHLTLPTKA